MGHSMSHIPTNLYVPRSEGDYITQVFEEIEGTVTETLSQEFSKTASCILGALSWLDDSLMIPLTLGHSGTAPETSRNSYGTNKGTNQDDSQNDPHPKRALLSVSHHGTLAQTMPITM